MFTKRTFLMLGIATMASAGQVVPSYATATYCNSNNKKAPAGYVCLNTQRHMCKPGCYCEGGGNQAVTIGQFEDGCANRWPSWGTHGGGWRLCPADFPYSDAGSSRKDQCYYKSIFTDDKVYYKELVCDPGSYLPRGKSECVFCKDSVFCLDCEKADPALRNYYCPGTKVKVTPKDEDQGVESCPDGTEPNAAQTECVERAIKCLAGSYLPADTEECAPCPSGYVCLGSEKLGGWHKASGVDQGKLLPKDACTSTHGFDNEHYVANAYGNGCDRCPIGTKANADHTECVETSIKVTKGYYLPANSVQQQKCSNPKKFCPGGNFWKSSVEQGQYDCPLTGTSASSNYQRCTVTLSGEQLQFGVMGNNGSQCWSKTDPEDFQYCVLGLRGIKTIPALSTATANSIKKITLESINSARTH